MRGLGLLGAAAALGLAWLLAVWPPPIWYRTHWPHQTAFMRARAAEEKANATPVQYRPVPLDSISNFLPQSVLIGEDQRFYDHGGIDYLALIHALGYRRMSFSWGSERDRRDLFEVLPLAWERRDKLRGASTITQQLAKNLYFSSARNPLRKVKEALTAYRLELALGKARILELYVNVAELGDGVWGAEAASRAYFRRSALRLTREQAAALAGSLPFPLRSNPGYRPSRMRWRQQLILRRLGGEAVEVPRIEHEADRIPPAPEPPPTPDSIPLDPAVVDTAPLVLPVESLPAPMEVDSAS